MKIDMNGMVYSLSYALDCVEAEVVGVSVNHAKWVAYLSTVIGKQFGMSAHVLSDLSACAALHDNALTQYLSEEEKERKADPRGEHCTYGEENVRQFPFYTNTDGFILYHHENADGSGPFGKRAEETPLAAQIIHFADMIDVDCRFHVVNAQTYDRVLAYCAGQRDKMYSGAIIDAFIRAIPPERYLSLADMEIDETLSRELPHSVAEYSFDEVKAVLDVFGKIVDYKSSFTNNHSLGIARKAYRMARFYGYTEQMAERLYVAGILHDIGKMAINNDILEKPDKLTEAEFVNMKNHAWFTYLILSKMKGFEDITEWASLHHEKLNGKGYPFGKTADGLSKNARLIACLDIYQALSEDRPYKPGMSHEKCVSIMREMAVNGFIDSEITEDVARYFETVNA